MFCAVFWTVVVLVNWSRKQFNASLHIWQCWIVFKNLFMITKSKTCYLKPQISPCKSQFLIAKGKSNRISKILISNVLKSRKITPFKMLYLQYIMFICNVVLSSIITISYNRLPRWFDQPIQSVSLAAIIHAEASVSSAAQLGQCCSWFLCCYSETLELSSTELSNWSIR